MGAKHRFTIVFEHLTHRLARTGYDEIVGVDELVAEFGRHSAPDGGLS